MTILHRCQKVTLHIIFDQKVVPPWEQINFRKIRKISYVTAALHDFIIIITIIIIIVVVVVVIIIIIIIIYLRLCV